MRALAVATLGCAILAALPPQNRKNQEKEDKEEEETQALQLPRELPTAVTGETRRLTFYTTPLSAKGLLSTQVRDALKALGRQAGRGQTVLHIRAFVAGAGDLRRVRDLVSEYFTARRQPLPALSLVRSGGLPLAGAQVLLEAITSNARKEPNPGGLAFLSARPAASESPLEPVAPLAARSLAALRQQLKAAGAEPGDVLRVTCFLTSLEDLAPTRALAATDYPKAAVSYVQTQRAPARAMAACEAVARLSDGSGEPLRLKNAAGLPAEPGQSDIALVSSRRVVLTGTQASFGYEENDSRLAFERLRGAMQQAGAPAGGVAWAHYYTLAPAIASQVRKLRLEIFDPVHPPAGALLTVEGLAAMDAGFALDAIAARSDGRAAGSAPTQAAVAVE